MDVTSEQASKTCLLVSTLIKVTEQFLSSVKHLQQDIADQNELQLSSIMDHYNRLNMVMKVFKIAYPLTQNSSKNSNTTNTSNVLNSTNNSKTLKMKSKPNMSSENKVNGTTTTTTTAAAAATTTKTITTATKNDTTETTNTLKKIDETPARIRTEVEEATTTNENISSNIFLDQFEKTAHEFGTQHNMDISQVWESLLIHALPEDKIEWANKTLFNKKLDWKTARRYYLNAYPDIQLKIPVNKKPFIKPNLIKTSDISCITQPSRSLVPITHQAKERQARYAEYLLSIEMKEYDSIADFNRRFFRYASAACMNLNDFSLSKRYVSSLLPKYRSLVEETIKRTPPRSLDETMNIASDIITPLEVVRRVSGEVCWKHPDTIKRNNLEDNSQPLKRFCA